MWRRWLPLVLALLGASLDAAGAHALAFHVLLMAVPAAAVSALAALGELIDLQADGRAQTTVYLQELLAVLGLALVVISAALRAPALLDPTTPVLAVNVLAIALALLCAEAVVASLFEPRPARVRVTTAVTPQRLVPDR